MNRFAKSLLSSAAFYGLTLVPAHAEIDVPRVKAAIEALVEADYPKLDALYKDIHAHPEIAFQEVKTVVSIGAIHGGTAENIIPDDVLVLGTIRTFKPEVRAKLLAGVERTAKAAAAMSDAPAPEIRIVEGAKAVMNDPGVVATAEKVLKAAFGDKFKTSSPGTPSEDYSEFINAGLPSMFFNIGVYEPERAAAASNGTGPELPSNHSPLFAPVPKPTIETGVKAMTLAVLSAFDQYARGK
ncbi:MAG: peptidase dimerization domain-containing protein [Bradyrhizobium sp.]